jgi:hypothetical protein
MLFAEELGEESCAGFIGVALAALRLRDSLHNLVDVLTASGPRRFAALAARYC